MNMPPFCAENHSVTAHNVYDFTARQDALAASDRAIFNPDLFRVMLDDPAQRVSFAAQYPVAAALFEQYLGAIRPEFPVFPTEGVTALQLSFFDNGEPQPRPSKAKRPREQKGPLKTRTRYGLNAKVWDRTDVVWTKQRHLAWEANAFMWSASEALLHGQNLLAKRSVSEQTADIVRNFAEAGDPHLLLSVFSQKSVGLGTNQTDVVAIVDMKDEFPQRAFIILSPERVYEATSFDDCTAKGTPLRGNTIAQARLPMSQKFERWGTQPVGSGQIS